MDETGKAIRLFLKLNRKPAPKKTRKDLGTEAGRAWAFHIATRDNLELLLGTMRDPGSPTGVKMDGVTLDQAWKLVLRQAIDDYEAWLSKNPNRGRISASRRFYSPSYMRAFAAGALDVWRQALSGSQSADGRVQPVPLAPTGATNAKPRLWRGG